MGGLDGKVCLITGAGQGVGRAIAIRFANEGADLVLCDIISEKLKETQQLITSESPNSKVVTSTTDISNEEQIKSLVKLTFENFEALSVLVKNAAITVQGNLIRISNEE